MFNAERQVNGARGMHIPDGGKKITNESAWQEIYEFRNRSSGRTKLHALAYDWWMMHDRKFHPISIVFRFALLRSQSVLTI